MIYVGRFAPSPTGPLHIGSLATAVASYVHARQAGGEWLVRIEDIDPPREMPGAADQILRTLEALELHWDRAIERQSTRFAVYADVARRLLDSGAAFRCRCSRSTLRPAHDSPAAPYPGTCRAARITDADTAIRLRVDTELVQLCDILQGTVAARLGDTMGDFVIYRRDGLPAYHLAVVLDDAAAGVTTIVRGIDLLDSTPAHLHLQRTLGLSTPVYCHVPVVVDEDGRKLSKQTGAIGVIAPTQDLPTRILELLGLIVPSELQGDRPHALWAWAVEHWRIESLLGKKAIAAPGGAAIRPHKDGA